MGEEENKPKVQPAMASMQTEREKLNIINPDSHRAQRVTKGQQAQKTHHSLAQICLAGFSFNASTTTIFTVDLVPALE